MAVVEARELARSCDPLVVRPHDPVADRHALESLAERFRQEIFPLVSIESGDRHKPAGPMRSQPSSLLGDTTGVAHLFGGEAGLLRAAEKLLRRLGLQARLAIADTAGAAWGWAHFGPGPDPGTPPDRRILPIGGLPDALDPLPIEALRIDRPTAQTLRRLGVETVGQLRGFPRGGLASRLGPGLLRRMDQAFGEADEPLSFHHPRPANRHTIELEYPTCDRAILSDRLETLVHQACSRLRESRRGALRLVCRWRAVDQGPIVLPLGLFSPTADETHLSRLLLGKFENLRLPSPIDRVTLEVTLDGPLKEFQKGLFSPPETGDSDLGGGGQPAAIARLVDTLSGRLGGDAVLGVRSRKDPLPERAYASFPLAGRARPDRRRSGRPASTGIPDGVSPHETPTPHDPPSPHDIPTPHDALSRPLTLHARPVPLAVLEERDSGRSADGHSCAAGKWMSHPSLFRADGRRHRVIRAWGPERIETGWWGGRTIRRDYFRLLTDRGQVWWVFRERSTPPGRWMVHGLFA